MSTGRRVAFQGEPGAFSEEAIQNRFAGQVVTALPRRSFGDVAEAVRTGQADLAMVPVENSIAGPVQAAAIVLDAPDLVVVDTLELPIRLCLMAVAGSSTERLRTILSHPMALAQCGRFLQGVAARPEPCYDTAGAAAHVARRRDVALGAAASARAAELHGLVVLARDIHDEPSNRTRFVLVAPANRQDLQNETAAHRIGERPLST